MKFVLTIYVYLVPLSVSLAIPWLCLFLTSSIQSIQFKNAVLILNSSFYPGFVTRCFTMGWDGGLCFGLDGAGSSVLGLGRGLSSGPDRGKAACWDGARAFGRGRGIRAMDLVF